MIKFGHVCKGQARPCRLSTRIYFTEGFKQEGDVIRDVFWSWIGDQSQ